MSKPKLQNQNQCQNQNHIKTKTISKPKPYQNQNHIKTKTIKTKSFGFGACLILTVLLSQRELKLSVHKFLSVDKL